MGGGVQMYFGEFCIFNSFLFLENFIIVIDSILRLKYKEGDTSSVDRAGPRELQGSADRGWTGEGLRVTRQRFPGELGATTGGSWGLSAPLKSIGVQSVSFRYYHSYVAIEMSIHLLFYRQYYTSPLSV